MKFDECPFCEAELDGVLATHLPDCPKRGEVPTGRPFISKGGERRSKG